MIADNERAIVGSINLSPGSFDDRRDFAIEADLDHVVKRLIRKSQSTTGNTPASFRCLTTPFRLIWKATVSKTSVDWRWIATMQRVNLSNAGADRIGVSLFMPCSACRLRAGCGSLISLPLPKLTIA